MSLPYSRRFIGGRFPAGSQPSYTVPSGYVAIIRSASIFNVGTGTTNVAIFVNGAWNLYGWLNVPGQSTVSLETRQVLNAGDQIAVSAVSQQFDATVSGYLLTNLP